jgi:branched-chain amino acid transport system substrate-binding protein
VAAAAVEKAGTTKPSGIISALKGLSVDTVVGPVQWGKAGVPPYIAKTPLAGGQWRATGSGTFPFELVVVTNKLAPQIPLGGKVEPLS